jgi:hypothetical protein
LIGASAGLSEAGSPCLPAVIEQNGFVFNVKVAARPYQREAWMQFLQKMKDQPYCQEFVDAAARSTPSIQARAAATAVRHRSSKMPLTVGARKKPATPKVAWFIDGSSGQARASHCGLTTD